MTRWFGQEIVHMVKQTRIGTNKSMKLMPSGDRDRSFEYEVIIKVDNQNVPSVRTFCCQTDAETFYNKIVHEYN
jgi:hypothetical protein